ncbi:nuclear transport factor 2 family protein [Chitinophagaceae bacterium 26-R-25]|nr:nuclear transport factor 2 family protein [Chitinophagaceae bacterium 26-R-25]
MKEILVILITTLMINNPQPVMAQQARDFTKEEENKKIAITFFYTFYNDKDLEKARAMMHPEFINHHPYSGKGIEETITAVNKHLFGKYPKFKVTVKRVAAEGDLVWMQSYTQNDPGDHGKMSMDIWRIKDGKIAEHWDIIQDIPKDVEPSSMYN